ncbi:MAG: AAA-like domain-containing protein, partial [Coleofasciculaceae cyanobacterium]
MKIDEVVYLLQLKRQKNLAPVQELVLRRAWVGETYASMAKTSHYEADYLRNAASQLWRTLSESFGEPINKVNLRCKLEPLPFPVDQQPPVEKLKNGLPIPITSLEFPSGPVPLYSPFYIERPPIEGLALSQISKPGSIVRIKAPGKMGKSSLMLRIAAHATAQGYQTVILDFLQAEKAVFASLEAFLRWFCSNISLQLKLEPRLDDYWHKSIGSKVSCSIYLQGYLLEQINTPLVLVLNEVNTIFEHPQIAQDFLPLLRSWHEESKHIESLQKLRLVVVHSTELYIPLDLNQSPFNVGLCLKLLSLTLEQIEDLAARHGLNWTDGLQ